ncbi:MAG: FHA domain-containing protein [Limnochordia bacterium]|jgi:hypothetical protein
MDMFFRLLNLLFFGGLYLFLHRAVGIIHQEARGHLKIREGHLTLQSDVKIFRWLGGELIPWRRGERIDVGEGLYLGRQEDNDLVIVDPYISGKHAEIFVSGPDCFLRDLGSLNCTRLNGQTIDRPRRLRPGDRIELGEARLLYGE